MENVIYNYLLSTIQRGALVSRGGEYLSPASQMDHIRALFEDVGYMEDFIQDDEGQVIEVRFDKVSAC
ncbi:MAG: hypothetical protein IJ873_06925 [Lachnospiraceae bacterium]|nr:hypothetical protein [Lachnospiraceae bacterium]MBR2275775.1 hypothetical protein [Lachnospiraceae bacterium]